MRLPFAWMDAIRGREVRPSRPRERPEEYDSRMSDTRKLTLSCPDCGCDLVVDAATGEVLSHRSTVKAPAGGKSFDDLLAGIDSGKARAEAVFAREQEAFKDRDRLLEEKFKEAMKRAEEDPDERPSPRPFDFD